MANMKNMRGATVYSVREAKSILERLQNEANRILGDERLSKIGKREQVRELTQSARPQIEQKIAEARQKAEQYLAGAKSEHSKVMGVDDGALTARAMMLSPILQNALAHPKALVSAYRRNFDDKAARLVIEETAASLFDVLEGTDRAEFMYAWNTAKEELASRKSPEETAAEETLKDAEQAAKYVNSAERMLELQLQKIHGATVDVDLSWSDTSAFALAGSEARVAEFEGAAS